MAAIVTDTLAARKTLAAEHWQQKLNADLYITVGLGTCGLAAGAGDTLAAIEKELEKRNLTAEIGQVGCVGMCSYEPMIELGAKDKPRLNYGHATAKNVPEIFASYFEDKPMRRAVIVGQAMPTVTQSDGHALQSLSFVDPDTQEKTPFHQKQLRIVLSNCGLIDPESIDDYLAVNGYEALEKVITQMTPEEVIEEVTKSSLRGRGGGGFPAGVKWGFARKTQKCPKYVICNAY